MKILLLDDKGIARLEDREQLCEIEGKQILLFDNRYHLLDASICPYCFVIEHSDDVTDGSGWSNGSFCNECGDHICNEIQTNGDGMPVFCDKHKE